MQEIILNNKPQYNFVIENFEGPLDLLLYLISKNKMNIFEISLSHLTDEYVSYLNEMNEQNIEVASEFIVMAATLLDVKARKLLPELEPKEEEEETLTEEDIIAKIIEYKKYKEVSEQIKEMHAQNFGSFAKAFEKIKFERKAEYTGQALDKSELCELYVGILERNVNKINRQAKEIEKIALYEKVTVKDKVKQIVEYLNTNENMVFNQMFDTHKCENIEVVTAFLGALELSKLKQVSIDQQYIFSDINISKLGDDKIKIDASNILD
ncbi:MAG: segregation/condensation protein A [Clostridia bacterium]|nr:segregation/condensation protein A [Clostridia bacterium]